MFLQFRELKFFSKFYKKFILIINKVGFTRISVKSYNLTFSVVFAGFSAEALAARVNDGKK